MTQTTVLTNSLTFALNLCIVLFSFPDNLDVQNLLSVVTSLLAFAHFSNKHYDKVLETLAGKIQIQDVGFNDLYLKGEDCDLHS